MDKKKKSFTQRWSQLLLTFLEMVTVLHQFLPSQSSALAPPHSSQFTTYQPKEEEEEFLVADVCLQYFLFVLLKGVKKCIILPENCKDGKSKASDTE